MTVLAAERTFWEKATLLHAEYHRPMASATPLRISRHYYDLHQLAGSEQGRRALADRRLLARVAEHKQVYFPSGWAQYEKAVAGELHLVPPEARRQEIAQDYTQMRDMFFGSVPEFGQLLDALQRLEERINSG